MAENYSIGDLNGILIIQILALVSTLAFFLAGSISCYRIHRTKSVSNVNFLPYLMTFLNCSLWTLYGVMKHDSLQIVVNGTGVSLQFIYMFVYFQNAEEKHRYTTKILACICFIMVVVLISQFCGMYFDATLFLGCVACTVSVIMFASPLSTVRNVFQTRSAQSISLPIALMTVIVSLCWFFYGLLINDYFVQGPNFLGTLMGLVQLYLIFHFKSTVAAHQKLIL